MARVVKSRSHLYRTVGALVRGEHALSEVLTKPNQLHDKYVEERHNARRR